jgi:hypothetical protein
VKGVNAESDEMRSGQEQKSTAELPFQMVEREVELETSVGEYWKIALGVLREYDHTYVMLGV